MNADCTYIGRHRKGGVEWVQIQPAWTGPFRSVPGGTENLAPVKGEIPRECFERITKQPFVAGQHHWITDTQSAAIRADRHYRAVEVGVS